MLKYILPICISVFLASCKSEEEKLKEKVYTVVRAQIEREKGLDGQLVRIDSFWLDKIDTLTDLFDSVRIQTSLLNIVSIEQSNVRLSLALVDSYHSGARIKHRQARLYASMFGKDDLLTSIQHDDVKEELSKAKAELSKIAEKRRGIDGLLARIQKISELRSTKLIDSTSFRGYVVFLVTRELIH